MEVMEYFSSLLGNCIIWLIVLYIVFIGFVSIVIVVFFGLVGVWMVRVVVGIEGLL